MTKEYKGVLYRIFSSGNPTGYCIQWQNEECSYLWGLTEKQIKNLIDGKVK